MAASIRHAHPTAVRSIRLTFAFQAKKELEASLTECRKALEATDDEFNVAPECTAPQPSHRRERRNWKNNNPDIHPLSRYALHEPDFEALSEKQPYLRPFLQASEFHGV